jgi:catechol 2,3-dioxygenase
MRDFQLPEKTHLCQVHLQTANLDRALLFYSEVPGFKIVESGGERAVLSATGDGPAQIILTRGRHHSFSQNRPAGPHLLAIRFPTLRSLAEACMRAVGKKVPVQGLVHQKVCVSCFLRTPDDYIVELYADTPRSEWRWHNGMIARSSAPLEVRDLFTMKDQQAPDTGMPSVMGIGHVDLYVRDLEPARRYFCDFLGMTATGHTGDSILLAAGFYHRHIALKKRPQGMRLTNSNGGLVSYSFEVPCLETVFELRRRAAALGYEKGLQAIAPGLLRLIDPGGCALEIRSGDCGAHIAGKAAYSPPPAVQAEEVNEIKT